MLWMGRTFRIIMPMSIRKFSLLIFGTTTAFMNMETVEPRVIPTLILRKAADRCHDYRPSICIIKDSLSLDIRVFLTSSNHCIGNRVFFYLYHTSSHSSHYLMRAGVQIYITLRTFFLFHMYEPWSFHHN